MITSEQIHIRLAKAIKQSKISYAEIARQIEVKESTLENYISGKTLPPVQVFANLCKLLDLNPNEILCIADYFLN